MSTKYRALVIRLADGEEHELVNVEVNADTAIDLMLQMQKLYELCKVPKEFAFEVIEGEPTVQSSADGGVPAQPAAPAPKPKPKKKATKKRGRAPKAHYDRDAIEADIKAELANKDIAKKHDVPIQVVYKIKHQMKKAETVAQPEPTPTPDTTDETPFHFTHALELRHAGYSAEAVRHKLNDYATYDQITDALDWADQQL